MKRLHDGSYTRRKRAKNVFSLESFGYSLQPPAASSSASARAGNLTSDGRRADVQALPIRHERLAPAPGPTPATTLDDDDWVDLPAEEEPRADGAPKRKRKRYATTDDNIRHWVANYRDVYLRVLVTREGFMGEAPVCPCGQPAKYRCTECFGLQLFCRGCVVEAHRLRPLCRLEAWNGTFFERRELRNLGLRVQLGHSDNRPCPHAHPGCRKFVVIASNGFHHVSLDFCQCRRSGSQQHWEQLLSYGWYPGTPDNPQSAITIPALKLFHAVSLQGKTTAYHFFNALAKITDNTGSKAFKRRYQLALRVVRQWRNLRALKRGGMGNDPDRCTSETREGELGSTALHVPKGFVKTLGEQKEMSTCTGLAALDHANTKYSQGYAVTGCGMVTCGRHEIVCKNGVGDLQSGEKYGNMDYIVASAFRHFLRLLFFLLSYDIMCQWSINLKERLLMLPPHLRLQLAHYYVKYVIPKLHILGHLKRNHEKFSLLYTLGAAQADMEGIERIWSSSGLMGASTREMGPGSRQDTLDDFWHYWNWTKVVVLNLVGETLRQRLIKARKELARQKEGLEEFSKAQQGEVSAWKKAVDDFETGASAVSPYELPHAGPTVREIELELMREEQEREHSSAAVPEAADDTMAEYLMLGLEIEGQQRQLATDLLAKKNPTTKDLTDFVTRRTRISRQIKKLRLMQRKYSPGATQRLAAAAEPGEPAEAERTPLLLPSGLSPLQATAPLSSPGLALAEARLRDGQCSESLEAIRHGLIVKKRLQTYKNLNARRQHQNTRSRTLVDGQQHKIDLSAETYRQARTARLALEHVAGPCTWRALEKADLRQPEDEEEAKRRKQRAMKGKRKQAAQVNENGEVRGVPGMGEKNRLISWIWMEVGRTDGAVGEAMYDGVRVVEWSKAYSRVKRWREEERLLQEEMARCLLTLEWQARQWDQRAAPAHYTGKIAYGAAHLQGATAFAARQAAVRRSLANRFRRSWSRLTDRVDRGQAASSSESSGVEEEDDSDDSAHDEGQEGEVESPMPGATERGENGAYDKGERGNAEQQGHEGSEGEGDDEGSEGEGGEDGEDADRRRDEMDRLLAIRTTSLSQYDEI
ncbi:hypothetical protein B0H14DRAFT_3886073 [Mycena olivaceomarginata]|nr:hypothetical protein B0H14DRAFT_3886073 [Mycena olivaceomarginata]